MPLIREQRPDDFGAVREVLIAAFRREAESRLVQRLRASAKKAVVFMVADERGRILGHVLFSPASIDTDGTQHALVDKIALLLLVRRVADRST